MAVRVKQVITPTVVGVLSGFLYFVFSYLDEFIAFVLLEAVALLWLKIWWAIRNDNKIILKGRRMSGQTEICAAGAWAPSVGAPPNIIHGLLWFDKLPSRDRLAEDIRTRLLEHRGFKRFLCGVYQPEPGAYCWDDPIPLDQFDLDKHITVLQVDGEDAVHRKVEDLLVLPIPASLGGKQDLAFPQWEVYMIQNTGTGRSVIAARFNHAMGDGLSLLNAFLALLTDEKGDKVIIPAFNPAARGDQEYEAVFKAQPKPAMGTEATAEPTQPVKPHHHHHHHHHKKTPFELFMKYAVLAIKAIPSSIESVMIGLGKDNDAPTCLKEKNYPALQWGPKRRMVIMPSWKLEDLKAIKTKHKCTINDVVISLLAGATSRFLKAHNDATLNGPKPPKVRVSLPFAFPRNLSLSPDTTEEGMRNLWSLVSVALNVDPKIDAVQRLAQSKLACDAMKNSPTPYLNMMMIQVLADIIPMSLKLVVATNVFGSHTFCLSNVPGPAVPVYLAGERADNICGALATLSSHVVVTSYNSTVTVSYVMNEELVPDYKQFSQCVNDEFQELLASAQAKSE